MIVTENGDIIIENENENAYFYSDYFHTKDVGILCGRWHERNIFKTMYKDSL